MGMTDGENEGRNRESEQTRKSRRRKGREYEVNFIILPS